MYLLKPLRESIIILASANMHDNNSFILKNKSFRSLFPLIDQDNIDTFFYTHPEPNSLKAIQDFLVGQGIESKVYNLPQEMLGEINGSFVAHFKDQDEFVVAKQLEKGRIEVINVDGTTIQSIELFNKRWTGIVLLIDEDTKNPVSGYLKSENKLKIWIRNNLEKFFVIILTISLIIILGSLGLKSVLLALLFIPLYASYSLVNIELGQSSAFDKLICSSSKIVNCESVINSPISKIFGKIRLSFIGLFYFTFLLILLFELYFINSSALIIFQTITALCLLITPISIYLIGYQIVKIGKICPYCITTQSIVILLGGCFFIDSILPLTLISFSYLGYAVAAIMLSFYLTIKTANTLKNKNDLMYYKNSYLKIKRNPIVFNSILQNEKNKLFPNNELILKSSEGSQNICFVLDLSCKHCVDAVKEYLHIKSSIENIGLCITFKLNEEDESLFAGFIDSLFLMYNSQKDWLYELISWYSSKEYMKANLNIPSDNKISRQIIDFTREHDLKQSPILLIDNTMLSNEYTYYDLSDILHIQYS